MRLLHLGFVIALASGLAAILIYITGVSNLDRSFHISNEDLEALRSLQSHFQQCVSANGLGLQAVSGRDYCEITMKFPMETISKWRDPKTEELEGLSFNFNLCEAVATWEQVRNTTTILTREYIDALPNGWEEYAWRRINKGVLLCMCANRRIGAGSGDLLAACSIVKKQWKGKFTSISGFRKAAIEHQKYVKGTTMYPLEHNPGHGLLCIVP
ncbi:sialyltransferase-like protein 2 [Olea europaea var. sylvestris]|uniref:sialyltransferase-like protein 2 n=1 Tax=Olea europaea var. sylvestris TaxID=158386 RepID=UPI000C1D57C2|nr:sialyltransferase-like protein 2 [Olea europaea var. sylvestris]